jgi:hypothetical protein
MGSASSVRKSKNVSTHVKGSDGPGCVLNRGPCWVIERDLWDDSLISRDHEDWDRFKRLHGFNPRAGIESIEPRHRDVEENQIDWSQWLARTQAFQIIQRLFCRILGHDYAGCRLQVGPDEQIIIL